MEYPNPAYTSFTIPTGATTGARITFNENGNGEILVYNSSNILVDSIGGSNGDIVNLGNPSIGFHNANLVVGNAPGFSNAATIGATTIGFQGQMFIGSGTDGTAGKTQASVEYTQGNTGAITGTANTPNFSFFSSNTGTTAVDVLVSGSLIHTDLTGVAQTWQTPTYGTGWSAATSIQGLGGHGIEFRIDAEDNLWINGLATAGAGATSTIFTLPVGYRPVSNVEHFQIGLERGPGFMLQEVAIPSTGQVFLGTTPNNGDTISINARIPLGHLS